MTVFPGVCFIIEIPMLYRSLTFVPGHDIVISGDDSGSLNVFASLEGNIVHCKRFPVSESPIVAAGVGRVRHVREREWSSALFSLSFCSFSFPPLLHPSCPHRRFCLCSHRHLLANTFSLLLMLMDSLVFGLFLDKSSINTFQSLRKGFSPCDFLCFFFFFLNEKKNFHFHSSISRSAFCSVPYHSIHYSLSFFFFFFFFSFFLL